MNGTATAFDGDETCSCSFDDVLACARKEGPSVQEWDTEDLLPSSSGDPFAVIEREEAPEMSARALHALRLMLTRSRITGKKKFVWISHSAFLAILFMQLEKTPMYVPTVNGHDLIRSSNGPDLIRVCT